MSIGPYSKFIVAALAAVLAAILPGLSDGPMGTAEWINVAILAAGAVQVLNAPNVTWWGYAKGISAGVSAVGVIVVSALTDGQIAPDEWVQIGTAVLVGVGGVVGISNGPRSHPVAA